MDKFDDKTLTEEKNWKHFLKKQSVIIFLILLTVMVSVITYYRIMVQVEMGPVSDSFDFLSNALVYAGQGTGYYDLTRPPFFSFIISLFFRLGFVSTITIFAVDGGLFVFGVIGLYLLLKTWFSDLESFLGALLYATFPVVLTVLGVGFSDLASVSFTIWSFYFLVLAVNKDSKFFYLSFPFAMLAFLTRYNSALIIFPIFLYILINKEKVNLKNMFFGLIASLLIIMPVFIFFYQKFGNILYPILNTGATSTSISFSTESAAYDPNLLFFIQKFPAFIGPQGITVLFMIVFGFVLYLLIKFIRKEKFNKISLKGLNLDSRMNIIKFIIFLGLILTFLVTFGQTNYFASELLFFVTVYLFYDITKNLKHENIDAHLLFLSWFMVFFIFQSIFIIKDNRYFVLMAPPVTYFMILGLRGISNRLNVKIRNRNIVFTSMAIVLTVIMLIATASQIPDILHANDNKVIANENMVMASQWFINYDPGYKNQNIYSDLYPNFSWYLKTDVKPVPVFKDNQTFQNGVKNYTFNQADSNMFNQYLNSNNADYYFCLRPGLNLTSYTPIKQFGNVTIYKRNSLA